MGDTSKYKEEKQIALGILAHVDAGKTTLSESMLHKGGIVDNIGRVDKKNAFLDNYELEKERGITIFSKQAVFRIGNMRVTLLDTPGHSYLSCCSRVFSSVSDATCSFRALFSAKSVRICTSSSERFDSHSPALAMPCSKGTITYPTTRLNGKKDRSVVAVISGLTSN